MPVLLLLILLPILIVTGAIGAVVTAVRWGFRVGVAGFAALIAALLLPTQGGLVPLAVFAGVLALLTIRGRRAWPNERASGRVVEQRPAPRPAPASVADWAGLRRLADWSTRRRIDAARERCDRYLLLAATEEHDSAQLPIRLARHLPTIIDDCVRHCRTATRDEQRGLVAQTLASIEGVADQAERRRVELAHAAQTRFRAVRAHLATPDE